MPLGKVAPAIPAPPEDLPSIQAFVEAYPDMPVYSTTSKTMLTINKEMEGFWFPSEEIAPGRDLATKATRNSVSRRMKDLLERRTDGDIAFRFLPDDDGHYVLWVFRIERLEGTVHRPREAQA